MKIWLMFSIHISATQNSFLPVVHKSPDAFMRSLEAYQN